CLTCPNGLYYRDATTGDEGACRTSFFTDNSHSYDYECDRPCWDLFTSNKYHVYSDIYSDGLEINNKSIGEMPIYQNRRSLMKFYKYCIDEKYYSYIQLAYSIGQNSRALAVTAPAALVGKIRSANNSSEVVAGYFVTAMVSARNY